MKVWLNVRSRCLRSKANPLPVTSWGIAALPPGPLSRNVHVAVPPTARVTAAGLKAPGYCGSDTTATAAVAGGCGWRRWRAHSAGAGKRRVVEGAAQEPRAALDERVDERPVIDVPWAAGQIFEQDESMNTSGLAELRGVRTGILSRVKHGWRLPVDTSKDCGEAVRQLQPFDLSRLLRTTEEIVTKTELEQKLARGKQLRIKYGVDVTAAFLHIGHAVNLWTMRDLQEHGHKVVFLIGDFTTRIGDPTDKEQTRGKISEEEIERNAREFIQQASRILLTDSGVFEVRRNSEWYGGMNAADLLELLTMVTHSRLIRRDMFERRIAAGREIYMHELVYPILQGYDSYALESDLTIVGTDQLFNELMGRYYQERLGQAPQVVLTTRITPGTDGREKQSKSLGNYIALIDPPRDMYGKAMSLADNLINDFLEVYTLVPLDEVHALAEQVGQGALNPMEAKRHLAHALVERYYGTAAADEEEQWFRRIFSQGQTPDELPAVKIGNGWSVLRVLEEALPLESRSELRRLLASGAVRLNGEKVSDPDASVTMPATLRVGRRRWFQLIPDESGDDTSG